MNKKLQEALSKSRSFQVAFRSVDTENTEKVVVEGYASTPDVDSYETRFDPSAFEESMKNYLAKNPIVLLQHNHDKPIGQVVAYSITPEGLTVRAEITEDWDGVKSAIKNRVLRGFSIGFNPIAYEFRMMGDKEIVVFTKVDIMEISVVSVPANPNSFFSLARSMQVVTDEIRAARAEDTQDTLAPAVVPAVVPENPQPVSEVVQPTENSGENPVPAPAEVVEQPKEEGVKAPESPAPADAADPVKDPNVVHVEVKVTPELQAMVDEAQILAQQADQKVAEAEAKVAQAEEKLSESEKKVGELTAQLEEVRKSLELATKERTELSSKNEQFSRELIETKERLSKSLTRGFSTGTPVNVSASGSYRIQSLVEIARSLKA